MLYSGTGFVLFCKEQSRVSGHISVSSAFIPLLHLVSSVLLPSYQCATTLAAFSPFSAVVSGLVELGEGTNPFFVSKGRNWQYRPPGLSAVFLWTEPLSNRLQ